MGKTQLRCNQNEFHALRGLCRSSVQTLVMAAHCCDVDQAMVNKLPDDALLDVFDSYLNDNDQDGFKNVDGWHTLVHVCRRWRNVVFASPRRLNLRLLCKRRRPVREMLDIWPPLPIVIQNYWIRARDLGEDNRIAALDHPDRVCSIDFNNIRRLNGPVLNKITAGSRVPFPELTYLRLWSNDSSMPVIPNSFLGGSAPRLRTLKLRNISFPAVSNLVLSASDLVDLSLQGVPPPGYISPKAMAACLSSLNKLRTLSLGFQSPRSRSRPDQPTPPPQTRIVLPALTDLSFSGMIGYSEDFLARIDAPVLDKFSTSYFLDLVFDVTHLKQFIGRAKALKPYKVANISFFFLIIRPPRLATAR
jgi:hypothetical protein